MTEQLTIDIPAGFDHCAAIYKPWPGGYADMKPSYGVIIPHGTPGLEDCYSHRKGYTARRPADAPQPVYIEVEGITATHNWRKLAQKAIEASMPIDKLLTGCALRARVMKWIGPRGGSNNLSLLGVQIIAPDNNFERSDILDEWIAERKGWFA